MRILIAPIVVLGFLALAAPCLASDIHLPGQTADQIKAICDKAGGKFSQDQNGYDCGTDCQGKPGTENG